MRHAPESCKPCRLRCERMQNPIGIDETRPGLSWQMAPAAEGRAARNRRQTAFRLLVARTRPTLDADRGDLWDSGKVGSDQSVHVPYGGKELSSGLPCFWKVKVWDETGREGPWSEPARFEIGLLQPADWQGVWIGAPGVNDAPRQRPAPFFRKEVLLHQNVRSARAYLCGLGYHELYINGRKVGDHVLDPGFTRYDRRVLYVTHDVTEMLHAGPNAIGLILGNGFFNQSVRDVWDTHKAPWRANPRALLQLNVTFADGSSRSLTTDDRWRVTEEGPIRFDATRSGERYDARREWTGWAEAGFDDTRWQPVEPATPPAGMLKAQMMPPIRVTATVKAVTVREVQPGVFVFDLGQNIPGWARLRVCGPAGTEVALRYAEQVDAQGRIDVGSINTLVQEAEFQTDRYTLKGAGEEVFEPRFAYHGFRYVEVTGFPGTPTPAHLCGRVVHTDFERGGRFACSNALLNTIQKMTEWSYVGNFHSIPTDCPTREKNGWTGDAHLAAEAGLYNFDAAPAYAKWVDDLADEQQPDGRLPGIVPSAGWGYRWGNGPCWDSAYLLIPWYLYLYRGDRRVLARHYAGMKRYVDYLHKRYGLLVSEGLADWVPPYGRPEDYTAPAAFSLTGYYYVDVRIVSQAAALLGRTDEAAQYAKLADQIKRKLNARFYDNLTGLYASGTQTAQAAALYQEWVPTRQRKKVARQLVKEVKQTKGRLNCGIHGTKHILHALTDHGFAEAAYRLATQTKYPSWGCWVEQGATTLWETWDGKASRNHIMFGDISAWFYKAIAGIAPDPEHPGFKHIIIRPHPLGDLTWARAEHESPYGTIRSEWKRENGRFCLEVVIPPNTTARVRLPASTDASSEPAGLETVPAAHDLPVYEIGSGRYRFRCAMP